MQTRVEDAEKGINQNTRRIMDAEGSIDTLQENYTSLQQNMDSITREFQQVKTKTNGAANTSEDTCETGVFISGIQEIMKSYNMDPRSDPVAVAGRLLKEIECFHAINRIYIADRAAVNRGRRHEARAVIVYLNSTFYKRQTTYPTEAAATKSHTQHPRRRPVSHPFFSRKKFKHDILEEKWARATSRWTHVCFFLDFSFKKDAVPGLK